MERRTGRILGGGRPRCSVRRKVSFVCSAKFSWFCPVLALATSIVVLHLKAQNSHCCCVPQGTDEEGHDKTTARQILAESDGTLGGAADDHVGAGEKCRNALHFLSISL